MPSPVEFRVRKVSRFVITRYEESLETSKYSGSIRTIGTFENLKDANDVAEALHKSEPESTLMQLDDIEPRHPPRPVTFSDEIMDDDGECQSCVEDLCAAGNHCVASSHTNAENS